LPTLKEDLIASIDRRWPKYEANNLYAVAATVDPRYKDCGFSDTSFAAIARTMVLREMVTLSERLSVSTAYSTNFKFEHFPPEFRYAYQHLLQDIRFNFDFTILIIILLHHIFVSPLCICNLS
jgi:hypothetical protein